MISRRRNLFVILLMAGLVLASLVVIATKETRLGLDLKGGVELVYQGEPTPQTEVTPEAVDRSIDIIRERVDQLGVAEPEIQRIGSDQISVGLPGVKDLNRAKKQVGTTAQLFFYDWEQNVIGNPQTPLPSLYDAVKKASERKPEIDDNNTTGAQWYMFKKRDRTLAAGPDTSREDLLSQFDGRVPPGNEILTVPPGTVVVRAETPEAWPDDRPFDRYFLLRDNPELKGTDIKNPEQQYDSATGTGGAPIVTFEFTDKGRNAFQDVTKRLAERGQTAQVPGQPVESSFQTFAIVLDKEVVSRPYIDYRENPDGIDGRTGAQISGGFKLQEAQDLANVLKTGALPITLKPISETEVSATLGKQALREGLIAGAVGLRDRAALPAPLLPHAGRDRRCRAADLRGPVLRADQAHTDHADVARHRRARADDRSRGGLQHRHLRANKGGATRGQIDRRGDLRRLCARHRDDHRRQRRDADHGVHPVRARDGGHQGLRVHPRSRDPRLAVHGGGLHAGRARRRWAAHASWAATRCWAPASAITGGGSTSWARAATSSRCPASS